MAKMEGQTENSSPGSNLGSNLQEKKKGKGKLHKLNKMIRGDKGPSASNVGSPPPNEEQEYSHPESAPSSTDRPPAPATVPAQNGLPIYESGAWTVTKYVQSPVTNAVSAHASATLPHPEHASSNRNNQNPPTTQGPPTQAIGSQTFPTSHPGSDNRQARPLPPIPVEAESDPASRQSYFEGDDAVTGALPAHGGRQDDSALPQQPKVGATGDVRQKHVVIQGRAAEVSHQEKPVTGQSKQFDEAWADGMDTINSSPPRPPKVKSGGAEVAMDTVPNSRVEGGEKLSELLVELTDTKEKLRVAHELLKSKDKEWTEGLRIVQDNSNIERKQEMAAKDREFQEHYRQWETDRKAFFNDITKLKGENQKLDADCRMFFGKNKKANEEYMFQMQENARLVKDYEEEIKNLKMSRASYLKDAIASQKQQMLLEYKALQKRSDGDVATRDEQIEKLRKMVEGKDNEYKAIITAKDDAHAKELESQKEERRATINALQEGSKKQRQKHEEEMEKSHREHDQEIEKLKSQHKDEKEVLRGEHHAAEVEMQNDYKGQLALLEKDIKKLNKDLKSLQDQHAAALALTNGKHKSAIEAWVKKHELELGERDQKLDNTVKAHQREIEQMKESNQRDLDAQLKGLKDTVKGLSAALVARNVPKEVKQLDDSAIKDRFLELSKIINDMSTEMSTVGWKPNRRSWTEQTLALLSVNEVMRVVKKSVVRDSIWSLLQEYIFASPFRIFGEEGRALEQQWYEAYNSDKQPPSETYHWPAPSWEAERWRYVTIVECRAALMAKSVSEHDKGRTRARLGFSDSLKKLNERLRLTIGELVGPESNDTLSKLALRASNIWLECGMQCCRIVVSLAQSQPGARVVSIQEKIQQVQPNMSTGSLLLTTHPKIGRNGNASGLDWDEFVTMREADKIELP